MWLAQMMLLTGFAAVAWIICRALNQQLVGQMIIIIAVFASINLTVQSAMPYYNWAKANAKDVQQQISETKKTVDETTQKVDQAKKTYDKVAKKKEQVDKQYQGWRERLDRFLWGDGERGK